MRWIALILFLPAMPASAAAGFCEDLWFTRNEIMNRAGYCFGSPLGQSLFDNSDCTGKSVRLDAEAQRTVDLIRERETRNDCRVDTDATSIDMADRAIRARLVDLPVRSEFESSCFGWQAASMPLFAGRSDQTAIVGRIMPGDNLLWSHDYGDDEWSYVTVTRGEEAADFQGAGWMKFKYDNALCRQWAG